MIGPLGNLPDDTDTNEIARHLHAISRHAEEVHIRTALMERQRSGHATYAQTLALILHATDGTLIGRVGGDGPTLAPVSYTHLFEAALAVMAWARKTYGWDHIDNYIDPGNARSIALALRLGGVQVAAPGADPTDVVIRHDLRGLA